MEMTCEKMILAILSGSDASEVVHALNDHGFYATLLSSTGGFLQKKSVTLMIGLAAERLNDALGILKDHAGERMETTFLSSSGMAGLPPMPVKVQTGGIVVFVLNVESCAKY